MSTPYAFQNAASTKPTLKLQAKGSNEYYRRNMQANNRHGVVQPSHPSHTQQTAHTQHLASNTPRQQPRVSGNAVTDLLPYCTTGPPLRQDQVIALSDVVGSLKELVLIARGAAAGQDGCEKKLIDAVGVDTASNVVGFFMDEWEME